MEGNAPSFPSEGLAAMSELLMVWFLAQSGGKRSVVSERKFGGNDGVVDGLVPRSEWRETLRRFRAKVWRQ